MPSTLHESLIEMFRERPELVRDLLTGPFKASVPDHDRIRMDSGDLTTVMPTEHRADAVTTLTDGADEAALGVIIEVQLTKDQDKKRAWPAYVANVHARHGCQAELLVICISRAMATWAAMPIQLGARSVVTPLALGPDLVPVIDTAHAAEQQPELAVLSAIAHGRGRHPSKHAVLDAGLVALRCFDTQHALLYAETMMQALPAAARRYLKEAEMDIDTYEPRTRFFRRLRNRTIAEGRALGLAEGRAAGEAAAVLEILDARGIDVPRDARDRITGCTDVERLKTWVRRAVTIAAVEELFD